MEWPERIIVDPKTLVGKPVVKGRILITFDKDCGELAFHSKLQATGGVILFRISAQSSKHIAQVAVEALSSRQDWSVHFSVIEDNRIRMTEIPS